MQFTTPKELGAIAMCGLQQKLDLGFESSDAFSHLKHIAFRVVTIARDKTTRRPLLGFWANSAAQKHCARTRRCDAFDGQANFDWRVLS